MDFVILHADANGLALTANSETVYGVAVIDTKPGPVALEVPPKVLGLLNDQWMRPMGDVGIAGPDEGKAAAICSSHRATRAPYRRTASSRPCPCARTASGSCYGPSWVRAATRRPAMATLRGTSIAPLTIRTRCTTKHIDGTGLPFDTIHPADIRYFEDLATMVEYEPFEAISLDEARSSSRSGSRRESRSLPTNGCAPSSTRRPGSPATWRSRSQRAARRLQETPDRQWFVD